ncbi:MAG: metal ABC transporter solute-binding protein, Zn/Mn family, partial [Pseudomonadota bacterium]
MRRGVRVTALLACLQVPVTAMAAPDVVTSILPLQSLTAMVMDGIGEPTTLLPAGASPHAYALRPSEAARLERADLVVWVGPDLERFLERPLA